MQEGDNKTTLVVSKEANLVYVRHRGSYGRELRMATFRRIVEHPDFAPGMCLIADMREVDLSSLTSADNQALASAVERYSAAFVGARCALIVSERVADYGIMRQLELMAADPREERNRTARVFTRFADACRWLSLQGGCQLVQLHDVSCELAGIDDPECQAAGRVADRPAPRPESADPSVGSGDPRVNRPAGSRSSRR